MRIRYIHLILLGESEGDVWLLIFLLALTLGCDDYQCHPSSASVLLPPSNAIATARGSTRDGEDDQRPADVDTTSFPIRAGTPIRFLAPRSRGLTAVLGRTIRLPGIILLGFLFRSPLQDATLAGIMGTIPVYRTPFSLVRR
ncbi:hypothetical protein Dimus_038531 [Dionaea muscipula]